MSGPTAVEENLDTWRWGREIPLLERGIFGARPWLLSLFALVTLRVPRQWRAC